MGYPTKVQLIKRKKTAAQYYINFPTAIAESMEFTKGEVVEWLIEDKTQLVLRRLNPPGSVLKKKPPAVCSQASRSSGGRRGKTSGKSGSGSGP